MDAGDFDKSAIVSRAVARIREIVEGRLAARGFPSGSAEVDVGDICQTVMTEALLYWKEFWRASEEEICALLDDHVSPSGRIQWKLIEQKADQKTDQAIEGLRTRKRQRALEEKRRGAKGPSEDDPEESGAAARRIDIEAALLRLSDVERHIIERRMKDATIRDIGASLGLSKSTVARIEEFARKRLAEWLKVYETSNIPA